MTQQHKLKPEDIASMDLAEDTLVKLRKILPEVFAEGDDKPVLDIEKLKIALGGAVDIEADDKTRYSFSWSGKKQAQAEANKPSSATLRPFIDESKDWDSTQNVYIEGDNLEVLKLLQKSYYGQVKMIYIDPPYNTGKDFVYKDNYHDNVKNYLQLTKQIDDEGNKVSTNTDKNGRYHTDWLNMMYPRLKLARNLLKDDGVIFISIDDNEVHNLRKICDEIFGEDNFIAQFIWEKKYTTSNNIDGVSNVHEYVLCFSKNQSYLSKAISRLPYSDEALARYTNPDNDPRGVWMDVSYHGPKTPGERPNLNYPIYHPKTNEEIWPIEKSWAYELINYKKHVEEERLWWGKGLTYKEPRLKKFLAEIEGGLIPKSLLVYKDVGGTSTGRDNLRELFGDQQGALFDNPKPTSLIKKLILIGCRNNELIVDFFSGSGTMAETIMQLNAEDGGIRKYICVQLPEATSKDSEASKAGYPNICEIGKERIRRAGDKILAEWQAKQQTNDLLADNNHPTPPDIGFKVFKLDTSNVKPLDASNLLAEDLTVPGRSALDLFYELVLKQGYSLGYHQTILNIGGTSCYALSNTDGKPFVLAVLDDSVKSNFAIKLLKYALKLVIVKDDCFPSDEVKLNTIATLEQLQGKNNSLQIRVI